MSGQVSNEPFAQIPEWILDAEISDRAVRVFCVLHRHAGKDGTAFPGRTKVAERVRCSKASLDRALNELRDVGAIVSQQVMRDGVIVGNDYWLWPAVPSSVVSTGRRAGDATGRRAGESTVGAPTRRQEREPENESQKEREPTTPASELALFAGGDEKPLRAADVEVLFESWWKTYPRRTAKGAARKSYAAALKKADASTLLEAARRFADDPNRVDQFTPHPATWLNQERWSDPPLPSRTGLTRNGAQQANLSKSRQNVDAFFDRLNTQQGEQQRGIGTGEASAVVHERDVAR